MTLKVDRVTITLYIFCYWFISWSLLGQDALHPMTQRSFSYVLSGNLQLCLHYKDMMADALTPRKNLRVATKLKCLSFQCLRINVYMIIGFVLLEKQSLECVQKDRQMLIWSLKTNKQTKHYIMFVCLLVCANKWLIIFTEKMQSKLLCWTKEGAGVQHYKIIHTNCLFLEFRLGVHWECRIVFEAKMFLLKCKFVKTVVVMTL